VGGLEPGFVPSDGKELGEDIWLGWRIRRAGHRIRFAPDAVVEHEVFERGPLAYVWARRRLWVFPGLVRRIPELREAVMYRRWFHSPRSAFFDLALVGAVLARWTGGRVPWLLAAPYAVRTAHDLRGTEPRLVPLVAATRVAADAVACGALVYGSVRHRSPLL
jgi:hypothetical protein